MNPFSLEGKTILVTGASSGIGRGIAIGCAQFGAKLVVTGRNNDRLEETLSLLEGEEHQKVVADLSVQEGIDNLVVKCPSLNGIVHCAGIPKICPVKRLKRELLYDIINTNEIAPILLTSALLKNQKIQRNSSIVFIASVAGVFTAGCVGDSDYAATKGALSGFSMTAARELASQQIRVNTICPGMVETPILAQANGLMSEDEEKLRVAPYPLKRLGKTEDIAYGAIYLLSDASSWVTGINLAIDGGVHL
jgi:NAD(P)-dependent dehydrogenase (short-subunit alcohol dehydrogenase family)